MKTHRLKTWRSVFFINLSRMTSQFFDFIHWMQWLYPLNAVFKLVFSCVPVQAKNRNWKLIRSEFVCRLEDEIEIDQCMVHLPTEDSGTFSSDISCHPGIFNEIWAKFDYCMNYPQHQETVITPWGKLPNFAQMSLNNCQRRVRES